MNNPRTRILVMVLGILAVGGLAAAGWFFLAVPYLTKKQAVADAEDVAAAKEDEANQLLAQSLRLTQLQKQSLPAGQTYPGDPDRTKREYAEVAKREYGQALMDILKESGAKGNNTVIYNDSESMARTGIPQVDPQFKPTKTDRPQDYLAYTAVVYKVNVPKTDLATAAEILRRYYSLGLLHQITQFSLKQTGSADLGADPRPQKERSDLHLEFTTRALIVHGAPARLTLLPVPPAFSGVLGVAGGLSLERSPTAAREMTPVPFEPVLATPVREYHYVAAKDPYHGLLPEPEQKVVEGPKKERDVVVPPKPNFSEFITYTTAIHMIEGDYHTFEISIKDTINNEDYNVVLTQSGETVRVKTTKWYYNMYKLDPNDRRKREYMNEPTLDISKPAAMSNRNNFIVYGIEEDGALVLGEKPTGLSPEMPKDDKTKPPVGGGGGVRPVGGGRTTLPPADPKAAVIGGLVVTAPKAEVFYRWLPGKTLKEITPLSRAEGEAAVKRVQTRFLPKPVSTTPPGK